MTDTVYRARRILTMNPDMPVVSDGGILVREGRIAALGPWEIVSSEGVRHDLGAVTIVPGLINAHAHLELSHLAGCLPAGLGFTSWADGLFSAMRGRRVTEATLHLAVNDALSSGTCYVADVVGREFDLVRSAVADYGLARHAFREYSGRDFRKDFPQESLPGSWSPSVHALYSTHPQFAQAIKKWCVSKKLPFSLHLSEVPGENELFLGQGGDFFEFMRLRRILPKGFVPPGLSAVAYADELGLLDSRTVAVHCVQVGTRDIELLASSGASVCLCPRSNAWIGVGAAPAESLHEAGVPLCLGTDSLASNADMNLWEELRALRRHLPRAVLLPDLLGMVTYNPARVLGINAEWGSLEIGKWARWAVLPEDFEDS